MSKGFWKSVKELAAMARKIPKERRELSSVRAGMLKERERIKKYGYRLIYPDEE